MTARVTDAQIDSACASLTDRMHREGTLHPDAVFRRTGAYGRTGVECTGGPYFGSGSSPVTNGTKREVIEALWAIARATELGKRSLNRR